MGCILAENKTRLNEKTRKFRPSEVSIEKYKTTQELIRGMPDECVEMLRKYVDVGVDHFMMDFPDVTDLETIRLFGEHVIPFFK